MSDLTVPKCWKLSSKPHNFCPGCGYPIMYKALGENIDEMKLQNKTFIGLDIGCALLSWDFFNVDTMQTHHGRTIPVVVGFKKVQPDSVGIAIVGDGGGYAIGAQHLINARMRNEPMTVIVVNNAVYGMTGGQEAPTSLPGQITSTSVTGADQHIIQGSRMLTEMLDDEVYIARGSVDNLIQLKTFIKRALEWQINKKGFSLVEVLSFCPTNWHTDAKQTRAFLNTMKQRYPVGEFKLKKNKE
ncbi:MAG: 2-oxoglutarate synthase [Candidatus Komeilibacteria bacterium CG_4_9_14_0_8_um_filter_36_9]|uniref:2-oxoglutarate synthase n=2 Tax=Candidatus Komeiliibacteriota TaxID=1817908 RepID=A0A2M8DRH5_9BACT|nr:MAG: 2-oxoglutarate synthase [Candidatus Komeilibacteria bacterium CG_4_10_14_0_8_um_filter_37_78]PJC01938.1 MAG: 2-oxoglutarate synthase [Candidatus Komeilibacteria bacterium CG_4_9_14_0_8_um_filter_36_9]